MTRYVTVQRVAVVFLVWLAAACAPSSSISENGETVDGEVLTVAFAQEPPDLHIDRPTNGMLTGAWIREALLESLFGVSRSLEFTTELLVEEPEVSTGEDGLVTIAYKLREGLVWSDGEPLTSADVAYTHERWIEGCDTDSDGSVVDGAGAEQGCTFEASSRDGIDLITDFRVDTETEFSVDFVSYYAGWKELWGPVFAKHAYGDTSADLNSNLLEMSNVDGALPTSGPMTFQSWSRGSRLRLDRNDRYHGSTSPDARNQGPANVAGVNVVFTADLDSQINGLLAREIDVIMAGPESSLERLAGSPAFTLAAEPGPRFEHWGFNLLNPHLAKPEVREAIAFAVDKEEIVEVLYKPLFGDRIDPSGLGNVFWMSNNPSYENHQEQYSVAEVNKATRRLEKAGYSQGGDGVYSHPSDGRLSLRVTTPPGNSLRELQIELMQAQLERAGLEIVIEPGPQNFFPETVASEEALLAATTQGEQGDPTVWDIAQFSWTSGPWPGSIGAIFRSGAGQNLYGFANEEYDALLVECGSRVDESDQADCYNELDRFVTTLDRGGSGLFVLPLVQQPSYFGYNNENVTEAPVVVDASAGGPLANVADYKMAAES